MAEQFTLEVRKDNWAATPMLRSPLLYPVQEALYVEVLNAVTGHSEDELPFWFVAIAKDTPATQWVRYLDTQHKAQKRVRSAVNELVHRFNTNSWDEFTDRTRTEFVPDNYLDWI